MSRPDRHRPILTGLPAGNFFLDVQPAAITAHGGGGQDVTLDFESSIKITAVPH